MSPEEKKFLLLQPDPDDIVLPSTTTTSSSSSSSSSHVLGNGRRGGNGNGSGSGISSGGSGSGSMKSRGLNCNKSPFDHSYHQPYHPHPLNVNNQASEGSDYYILHPKNGNPYPPPPLSRMARLIADEFLTEERERKYYADHYRCLPPPLFIISTTLIELGVFTYYSVWDGSLSSSGPLPLDSPFIYRPDKRDQVWRFFLYAVLHAGWVHLMFNLVVQLLVGLPLEMVHGSARIGIIYMAGVIAGSLGTSVLDPDVCLVGASGGVYALLAAHLANVLLNYNNMEFGVLRLLGVFVIASVDVGFAIFDRYAAVTAAIALGGGGGGGGDQGIPPPPVSYVAHLMGALAGLTIGLVVLKNFEQSLKEQLIWWVALGLYATATIFAILFNIFRPLQVQLADLSSEDFVPLDSSVSYSELPKAIF